jgi:hypothetical protein
MELPDISFKKAEYIETASGNRVSRQSVLCGSQNIVLNGKNIVQFSQRSSGQTLYYKLQSCDSTSIQKIQ